MDNTTETKDMAVPLNTVHITDKATKMISSFASREGYGKPRIRVAVKGGGCSGLVYVLELTDSPKEDEKIIKSSGDELEVYIPKKAFVFLAGTVLDFSDGLNGKGFEFRNPNAKRTCGCGNSFAV